MIMMHGYDELKEHISDILFTNYARHYSEFTIGELVNHIKEDIAYDNQSVFTSPPVSYSDFGTLDNIISRGIIYNILCGFRDAGLVKSECRNRFETYKWDNLIEKL